MLQPFRQRRSLFCVFSVLILLGLSCGRRVGSRAHVPSSVGGHLAGRRQHRGRATSPRFNVPTGIAVDGSGTLYVADSGQLPHQESHGRGRCDGPRRGERGAEASTGRATREVQQSEPNRR